MNKSLNHYNTIADLFEYPEEDFTEKVNSVQNLLNVYYPEAANELKLFTEYAASVNLNEKQEIYTRTFDVQAITTMDLGYILFGDDYKRGELLSNLSREHVNTGNELNNQLGDHISNLLRLLPRLEDDELINELVKQIIHPALTKIIEDFNPDKLKSKNELYKKHHKTLIEMSDKYATYYKYAFITLFILIKKDFNIEEPLANVKTSEFLDSVKNEFETEHSK